MSREDASYGTAATEDTEHSDQSDDDRSPSRLGARVRGAAKSGALAGVLGGATVLRGVRSLRVGKRVRGLGRLVVGGALLAVAAAQRRAGREPSGERIDIDQSDVVDTGPDIDGVGESGSATDHVGGEAASDAVDTGPDIDEAIDESEAETDADPGESGTGGAVEADDAEAAETAADAGEAEPERREADEPAEYDRLGAAAFDEHANEVPVPQAAFNRGFLSLGGEAHWGVRDDGTVVVSELFDPLEDGDGVEYVASTRVDDERTLTVPDEVTDHWDDASGGPMAVEGGDDIVFAASDGRSTDDRLFVVPGAWAEEVLGETA